ncbi:MAG: hypothetical protein QOJ38_36 [Solirubrobacterales bacterium]|jgi:hypothetical protein|nr:hypothetical protein [Solirubrobacterales bacterium]
MRKPALISLVVAIASLLGADLAHAGWTKAASGSAASRARAMPAGNQPATSVSGRNVTVSWAASSFAGGSAVSGYTVRRYNGGGQLQTIGASCTGTISALSCTEQAVPAGSWKYSVTPKQSNWVGTESSQSAAATVASPALSFSSSTTLTSLPSTLSGNLTSFVAGQTVTFKLDNASTGTVLSGSISPSPVATNGSAGVTVTIPTGTSNGAHTVYAVGNQGDTASAAITVAVPTTIATSAWDLRDASSAVESNQSSTSAFATDARTANSGNFATSFQSSRYIQWDYNAPLQAGLGVSSPNFNFSFASSSSGEAACFYFEVRRASTGAVIGTHGSTSTPVACNSTTVLQTTTTALPEVTSSDIANDLRVRLYGKQASSHAITVDLATISGSAASTAFTLYDTIDVDSAGGSAVSTPWGIAAAEGTTYNAGTNWSSSFSSLRYLKLSFPAYVPSSAAVGGATFTHAYRPATAGSTTCYWFEVYSGVTVIGTHGSTTTPVSCNSSTSSFVTDAVSLPEINSPARANGAIVKIYVRDSGSKKSQHDIASLAITYTP